MIIHHLRRALLLACLCTLPFTSLATPLQQAITDFEQENYEEALQALETLRAEDASGEISFYLGMTYHAMGDARNAVIHLEEAAAAGMSNDALYLALAQASLGIENYSNALTWLEAGEEAGFRSGESAYLKGVALARQMDYKAALTALDEAERRSPELAPKANYLRAQIYVADNEYERASQVLQDVINAAPESNLAESAREYNRRYQQMAKEYSPWRGAVQLGYMYDSNSIAEPEQTIPGLPDAEDSALNGRFRIEYAPRLSGRFLFSTRYDVNSLFYDENSIADQVVQNLAISPGYRLNSSTMTAPFSYTHQTRDGENYEQTFELIPTFNLNLDSRQILQLAVGYAFRDTLFDFANAATEALESREGDITLARLGYYYLFAGNRGMANVRYEFSDEQTDGLHWVSQGHRFEVSGLLPMGENVTADLYAGVYAQDFDNFNTIFGKTRSDTTKNAALGITWMVNDNVSLYGRYQYTRADSNIFIYEYRRSLAMLGVEYGF